MRVLITGAAHGLGRALTEELLRQGHQVVAADRETDTLENMPMAHRGACTIRFVDLESADSIQRLLTSFQGQPPFDLVFLNAGISATGKFEEIPEAAYDKLIAVNLFAPIYLASRLVGKELMGRKSKIVFISSLSHAMGYPGAAVYAATKDGRAGYARCAAQAFKKERVRVLTVFPGPINTAHAQRHAPEGSKASKRMAPQKMAKLILRAAKGNSKTYYPGTKAYLAALFGKMMPGLATRLMRRGIYDKLKGSTF
ncbi:MAG: SDR family NAD(P)-dependent oxidoreductase [Rhizobiaceae bacterium]